MTALLESIVGNFSDFVAVLTKIAFVSLVLLNLRSSYICVSKLCMNVCTCTNYVYLCYVHTYIFPLLVSILVSTVYSAASSVSNSVRGFKEYFDFHKSTYDNVCEYIYIRTHVLAVLYVILLCI